MKPYPKYKDSGVLWLDHIPKHWETIPLCAISKLKSITNCEHLELLSVYLDRGVVRFSEINEKRTNTTSEDKSKYQKVEYGDFVLNNQQAWRGSVGVSMHTGIVSPAYLVLGISNNLFSEYANYLFRDKAMVTHYLISSKGVGSIQRNLYWPQLKRIPVLVPPFEEQKQISRYLDWKTSKINKFIKAKKKLITLLKEQKRNIINEAVTKGIHPDVKMKDSGVEWLGEIPAHWEVRKFKHFSRFYSGGTPSKAIDSFWKGDIPWVSPKDMKTKYIFDSCDHISREAVEGSSTSYVDKGQMLMVVRSGILRRTIPVCIAQKKLTFNQDIRAIALDDKFVSVEYFYLFIIGCEKKLLDKWLKVGATVESIEYEYMANSYLPIPPMVEQNSIVDYIEKETALIDKTITRTEREIELIQEYRIRLVSDVVTGKVDVRSVEIPKCEFYPLLVEDFEMRLGDEEEILGEGGEE